MSRIPVSRTILAVGILLSVGSCSSSDTESFDFGSSWHSEVGRLESIGCDMTSAEATKYQLCLQQEMENDYNSKGYVSRMGEYLARCNSYLVAIPGCDSEQHGEYGLSGSGTFGCPVSADFFEWTTSRLQGGWRSHDGSLSFPLSYNFGNHTVSLTLHAEWKATLDVGGGDSNYYEYEWNGDSNGELRNDGWFESDFTLEEVRVFTVSWDETRDVAETSWESHIVGFIDYGLNRAELCWCNGPGDWAVLDSFRLSGKDNFSSDCPCPHPGPISCIRTE